MSKGLLFKFCLAEFYITFFKLNSSTFTNKMTVFRIKYLITYVNNLFLNKNKLSLMFLKRPLKNLTAGQKADKIFKLHISLFVYDLF